MPETPALVLAGCLSCLAGALPAYQSVAAQPPRSELVMVTDEAEAALEILALREAGRPVAAGAWRRLFESEGYRRLKARESAMGRAFEDSTFQTFLLSDTLLRRAPALRQTLADWRQIRLQPAAGRALAYLPEGTRLRARVYLLVKPRTNSFVFEIDSNPAIMLYLDPALPPAKIENTIAHELHHVGYAAACGSSDKPVQDSALARAHNWLSAFGEGVAMLAAAGGPDVHPHAVSPAHDRARWDRDVARAPADLRRLERFFLDILEHRLADPDSTLQAGMSFFGKQGPWYTVGWLMASVIEQTDGRAALVESLCDQPWLLRRYNEAARRRNPQGDKLPRWSDRLLRSIADGSSR